MLRDIIEGEKQHHCLTSTEARGAMPPESQTVNVNLLLVLNNRLHLLCA
jgi:hypothetical protein